MKLHLPLFLRNALLAACAAASYATADDSSYVVDGNIIYESVISGTCTGKELSVYDVQLQNIVFNGSSISGFVTAVVNPNIKTSEQVDLFASGAVSIESGNISAGSNLLLSDFNTISNMELIEARGPISSNEGVVDIFCNKIEASILKATQLVYLHADTVSDITVTSNALSIMSKDGLSETTVSNVVFNCLASSNSTLQSIQIMSGTATNVKVSAPVYNNPSSGVYVLNPIGMLMTSEATDISVSNFDMYVGAYSGNSLFKNYTQLGGSFWYMSYVTFSEEFSLDGFTTMQGTLQSYKPIFQNVTGSITNGDKVIIMRAGNDSYTEGCSLLSFGEKGFEISGNNSINIGGQEGGDEYVNKQFTHLLHAKGELKLTDNKEVIISDNKLQGANASALSFNSTSHDLIISGNDKVLFSLNLADSGETLPYAIKGSGKMLYLNTKPEGSSTAASDSSSAQDSNYIRFYQPIHWTGDVELNSYNNSLGAGEILFSGKNVDTYLTKQTGKALADLTDEVRVNARASDIFGNITLNSGALTISDSAILSTNKTLLIKDNAELNVSPFGLPNVSEDSPSKVLSSLYASNLTLEENSKLTFVLNEHASLSVPSINLQELSLSGSDKIADLNITGTIAEGTGVSLLSAQSITVSQQSYDVERSAHTLWVINRDFCYNDVQQSTLFDSSIKLEWVGNDLIVYNNVPKWLKGIDKDSTNTWRGSIRGMLDTDKMKVTIGGQVDYMDRDTCWIQAASNVIEYWQSKYAPLYQGNVTLPTNKQNLDQALAVRSALYYDNILVNPFVNGGLAGKIVEKWFNSSAYYERFLPTYNRTFWDCFDVRVREYVADNLSMPKICNNIEKLYEDLQTIFSTGVSPAVISYGAYKEGFNRQGGHVVTCWGVSKVNNPAGIDPNDFYLVVYFTDSDTEAYATIDNCSTMWLKLVEGKVQVIQYNGRSVEKNNYYIDRLAAISSQQSGMDAMLVEVANPNNPLYWTGKARALEWRARNGVYDNENSKDFHLAESTDGWKKKVSSDVWAHAFFHKAKMSTGSIYDALYEANTSFVFGDFVDDNQSTVIIPDAQKKVTLPTNLNVKSVEVSGKGYEFSGIGQLTASAGITISGSLALKDTVKVSKTSISVSGGTFYAYNPGVSTVSGGSITLKDGGALWFAGFNMDSAKVTGATDLKNGYYSTLQWNSVSGCKISSPDKTGKLGAYIDLKGAAIDYVKVIDSDSTVLDSMVYKAAGVAANGGFTCVYEWGNGTMDAQAVELASASLGVYEAALNISGSMAESLTIGSHGSAINNIKANISVSENSGSSVTAQGVNLATVAGDTVSFNAETQIATPLLTVTEGSRLMNDGRIGSDGAVSRVEVASTATLGGSGRFGKTMVQSGGTLMVGNSPGAPVYDDLSMEAGSTLIFCLDGREAATAEKNGWGSGTHSLLTVTGTLDIALGTEVQVGCSLDFLNAADLGATQTLTLIQLSAGGGDELLAALQSGTEFLWSDADALAELSEVGATVRDAAWSVGDGNTLQLSFIVSSAVEDGLRWTNAGGNGLWDATTQNWQNGAGTQAAFAAGSSVMFYDGATVRLQGELQPEMVLVSTAQDVVFEGSGSIAGEAYLQKEGSGTLSIRTANSYSGGTSLLGGRLVVQHAQALGSGGVQLVNGELVVAADDVALTLASIGDSTLTVQDGYALNLTETIFNSGTLTINGILDVSEMAPDIQSTDNGNRIDVSGNAGKHGFQFSSGGSVVVVEGGGILLGANASVVANGVQLTLGEDGVAGTGTEGGVSYASYLVGSGHSVSLSDIVAAAAAHNCNTTTVELQGGFLTADCALTGGLSTSDNSTLVADNWQQNKVISNSGTLTLRGNIIADALDLQKAPDSCVDFDGQESTSGFVVRGGSSVVLVNGGTVVNDGVSVTHGNISLTLGSNGMATSAGTVDYSLYRLNGNDSVALSAVLQKSATAKVEMSGGKLLADATAEVQATGGEIALRAGELSGCLSGTQLSISGGMLTATLCGSNTLSGDNKLSNVLDNDGTLTISGTLDVTAVGELVSMGDIYTEGGNNGFKSGDAYSIKLIDNSGTIINSASIKHGNNALTLGSNGVAITASSADFSTYYITAGHRATASVIKAQAEGKLEGIVMSGGVLTVDADATVETTGGEIKLNAGVLGGHISGAELGISGGKLTATLSGSNTLFGRNVLSNVLDNAGALTISGTLDITAVGDLTASGESYSEGVANGFKTGSSYSIRVVDNGSSGTLSCTATVKHGDVSLLLGSNGMAVSTAEMDFSTYYMTAGHEAAVSSVETKSGGKLELISMSGGVLNADASAAVAATGGEIRLSAGELSGSISGAQLGITGGCLSAMLQGNNTLSGNNKLSNVLENAGALTISGTLDVSGIGELTRYADTYTEEGQNGFRVTDVCSIRVVNNGTHGTLSSTATLNHGNVVLSLDADGVAHAAGTTDYSAYYINSGHRATVSAIDAQANGSPESIELRGGELVLDADATLAATGGTLSICDDAELRGALQDTAIVAGAGAYQATIQGTIGAGCSLEVQGGELLLASANQYSGGTVVLGGTLKAAHAAALGGGAVVLSGGSLDLGGLAIGNDVTVKGAASIKQGTAATGLLTLESGELRMNSTYRGDIVLQGGTLVNATGTSTQLSAGTVTLGGATLEGDFTIAGSSAWVVNQDTQVVGSLTLGGHGELSLQNGAGLDISGTLVLDAFALKLGGAYKYGETYTLISADSIQGDVSGLTYKGTGNHVFRIEDGKLLVDIKGQSLVWNNAKKTVWQVGAAGWNNEQSSASAFSDGDGVTIGDGTVSIVGDVSPSSVLLNPDKTLTFKTKYDKKKGEWSGAIAGEDVAVTIAAASKGKVTLNDGNTYTGTTSIESGTVNAGGAASFGGSEVVLHGGTLDLKSKAVENSISLDGQAAIKGGKKYTGLFTMSGGELQKGSVLDIKESATISGGKMNGSLSGTGTVYVTGNVELGDAGKLMTHGLEVSGTLKVGSKGLAMNTKTSAITINGGKLESAGKLSANSMTMNGGQLKIYNAKPMPITFKQGVALNSSAVANVYGNFTAADLDVTNSTFALGLNDEFGLLKNQKLTLNGKGLESKMENSYAYINGSMSVTGALTLLNSDLFLEDNFKGKAMGLTVKGALDVSGYYFVQSVALSGKLSAASLKASDAQLYVYNETAAQGVSLTQKGVVNSLSNSHLSVTGNMTVAGGLRLENSSILLEDIAKGKAMGLTVKDALSVSDTEKDSDIDVYLTGKLAVGSLKQTNADVEILNDLAAQSIALTQKYASNELSNAQLYANGSMTVAGHLIVKDQSYIKLEDSAKGKAMNLAVKGDLLLSGSSITLSGALSAANMTLESGSSINLTSTKWQTIKVSKTLAFDGNINLGLQDGLDIKMNKGYNLITFKTLEGVTESTNLYNLLGLADEYCTLTLDLKKKAITLMVTEEEWNQWVSDHTMKTELEPEEASIEAVAATAAEVEPGITTVAAEEEETPEEEEAEASIVTTTLPVQQGADVAELIAKVSDTLVQTTWGTAKASRAFVDSLGNRGQNATALSEGRGAAWGGVIGATSRLSSHGGSLGADHTLSGAVFGAEMNATPHHSIGMAMGVTWGEINTLSAYNVDQDSTHLAAYGQSRLGKSLTLDWSAAYGRSENDADILGNSYDWTQHALQLDARLSYAYALNERTTLRGFGGMQYLHIDSDTPEKGLKADSMQNVRVEVGVGATYMATAKTAVYGEVSFIGDLVRDNPATYIGGNCRGGSNPGRAGMNMTVGATHALNDSWSLNASYNMELQPRANAHNATIGAAYRF